MSYKIMFTFTDNGRASIKNVIKYKVNNNFFECVDSDGDIQIIPYTNVYQIRLFKEKDNK